MSKYDEFKKTTKKTKKEEIKKEVNIDDIIHNASYFFERPITIVNRDEFSIELKGENGIKKEDLLEYLSKITDERIKEIYIKENLVHIEL